MECCGLSQLCHTAPLISFTSFVMLRLCQIDHLATPCNLFTRSRIRYLPPVCGRFTLKTPRRLKFDAAGKIDFTRLPPRYNIAPSQEVVTIVERHGERFAESFKWGLIPSWSKEPKALINARSETLCEKASFKESFERRRCLIPADGFFEWQRSGKWIQPYYFQITDESPFAFAGIWDSWGSGSDTVNTCAIITTNANRLLAPIHDRMPVILLPESYDEWLSDTSRVDSLMTLLEPYPADAMKSFPVSSRVNSAVADEEELVKQVEIRQVPVNGRLFE